MSSSTPQRNMADWHHQSTDCHKPVNAPSLRRVITKKTEKMKLSRHKAEHTASKGNNKMK
ncbi:unnamed protein product [Ceratitis capitata]|uniref:(Mediterranean fruit fly) hypothetical protein n=1 Tax=Ceratitis capitata TaxID=7213 RepID=A0A811UN18_CERCA|nr:unnamed protein product [Ceratitis capitata]